MNLKDNLKELLSDYFKQCLPISAIVVENPKDRKMGIMRYLAFLMLRYYIKLLT